MKIHLWFIQLDLDSIFEFSVFGCLSLTKGFPESDVIFSVALLSALNKKARVKYWASWAPSGRLTLFFEDEITFQQQRLSAGTPALSWKQISAFASACTFNSYRTQIKKVSFLWLLQSETLCHLIKTFRAEHGDSVLFALLPSASSCSLRSQKAHCRHQTPPHHMQSWAMTSRLQVEQVELGRQVSIMFFSRSLRSIRSLSMKHFMKIKQKNHVLNI